MLLITAVLVLTDSSRTVEVTLTPTAAAAIRGLGHLRCLGLMYRLVHPHLAHRRTVRPYVHNV
ncbi:uncharacterized protein B0H18DRAFT_144030 [Fomitopsis serialis]|uniref:uncharacterized protein n=1 Tax=Fomitopsis serialis TaxID=139415 RepID=UPI002007F9FE|nr:uncharacterized protein B0H18DRAFT_144030 [Neoantrodia serialis]KAH9930238.1 hypothetical protein B0H18DRAFT_144030 [Neoantrodia serialis]